VHETATYRCDDTRGCVMQFWPPDDEHMVLETCRGMKYTNCKTKLLCIKLVNYWDKYTEMHGQQNVKILSLVTQILEYADGHRFHVFISVFLSLKPSTGWHK